MKTSTILLLSALFACGDSRVVRADLSFKDLQGTVIPATNGIDLQSKAAPSTADPAATTNSLHDVDEHGHPVDPPANATHVEGAVVLPAVGLARTADDIVPDEMEIGDFPEDRAIDGSDGNDDEGRSAAAVGDQIYDVDGLRIYH